MNFNGFINVIYKKFDENKRMVEGKSSFTIDDLPNWDKIWGFVVPEDIIVVDSDNDKEGEALVNIIKETKTKCYISKTTHGYHFYFRVPKDKDIIIKNLVKAKTPLGLVDIDYKNGQRNAFIIEKKFDKWNEWIIGPEYNDGVEGFILNSADLDELPYWLYPLKTTIKGLIGMTEHDGRNEGLFHLATALIKDLRFDEAKLRFVGDLINRFVFADPLSDRELNTCVRFDENKTRQLEMSWFNKNTFLHNELAKYLSQMLYCYKDKLRNIWFYDGKYYTLDTYVLEKAVADAVPILKDNQRQEVVKYMKFLDFEDSAIQPIEYHDYICVKNGLVNAKTGKLIGFTPAYFIDSYLDIEYNANAYDEHVDKFLDDVLVKYGDKEQRMIFEEFLGYTLIAKDNFMKKMLFCIGPNADNGKSTTLSMVQELLNNENYSALKLFEINAKNDKILVELVGKLANFDDDADASMIKGSNMAYLKTLISDENKITVNPKFKSPYKTFVRAKFWVASNHIIKTEQKGDEWMTRLEILAFNNQFKGAEKDPTMKYKLRTDNAKSYLLKLAIEGYQRLIRNNAFTISAESERWAKQYRIENDTTYRFLLDKGYKVDDLEGMLLKTIDLDYNNYMKDNYPNITPTGTNKLERRILEYFNNELKSEVENNERIFKKVNISK